MVGERIKNLRLNSRMTQHELGSKLGVSSVTVSCWEVGKKTPSLAAILSLCELFNISTDCLLGTNSKDIRALSQDEHALLTKYRDLDNHGKTVVETVCSLELARVRDSSTSSPCRMMKLYSIRPAAGSSAPNDDADYELIPVQGYAPKGAEYCVCISGNSMYPYIGDGDIVYVQRTESLRQGDVGIISVDGSLYCKQYFCKDDGTLILVSANPEFKHTNVVVKPDGSSFVKIFGRVLLDQRVDFPEYLFEDM